MTHRLCVRRPSLGVPSLMHQRVSAPLQLKSVTALASRCLLPLCLNPRVSPVEWLLWLLWPRLLRCSSPWSTAPPPPRIAPTPERPHSPLTAQGSRRTAASQLQSPARWTWRACQDKARLAVRTVDWTLSSPAARRTGGPAEGLAGVKLWQRRSLRRWLSHQRLSNGKGR